MADALANPLAFKPTLNGSGEEFAASQALKQRGSTPLSRQSPPISPSRRGASPYADSLMQSDLNRQQRKSAQTVAREQASAWPTSAPAALKEAAYNPPYPRSGFKRGLIISKEYGRNIGGNVKRVFGQAKEEAAGAATKGMAMGTSYLLKQCWLNIIDSYGLTLIWINIHVFCRFVFGEQYFCKLGQEWTSGGGLGGVGGAAGLESAAGKGAGAAAGGESILGMPIGGIGLAEAGLLALLDAILIIAIIISIAPYLMLAYAIADPAGAIWTSVKTFAELAKTTVGQ